MSLAMKIFAYGFLILFSMYFYIDVAQHNFVGMFIDCLFIALMILNLEWKNE